MSLSELAEIASRNGTDKWNYHWYAGHYAKHFESLRAKQIRLLEIGVGGYDDPQAGGASLRMWKEYFPNAQIVGLDYYDKSAHEESRIKIYQGSQSDPLAIARIVSEFPDGFDIIIDDGSHRSEHVTASLLMLWQYLKKGGCYVVEDLQTSYWPQHGGSIYDRNSASTSMGFIKSLIDGMNWQEMHHPRYSPSNFDLTITGMHFYHNMVFIDKGDNNQASTEVKGNRILDV